MQITSTCSRLYRNYITLFYNVILFFFISYENINAILNTESIWTDDFLKLNTSLTSTTVDPPPTLFLRTALDPYSLWGSHFSDNSSLRLVCSSFLLRLSQSLIFVISSCDCKQLIYIFISYLLNWLVIYTVIFFK